jgi:hypothetical protein
MRNPNVALVSAQREIEQRAEAVFEHCVAPDLRSRMMRLSRARRRQVRGRWFMVAPFGTAR